MLTELSPPPALPNLVLSDHRVDDKWVLVWPYNVLIVILNEGDWHGLFGRIELVKFVHLSGILLSRHFTAPIKNAAPRYSLHLSTIPFSFFGTLLYVSPRTKLLPQILNKVDLFPRFYKFLINFSNWKHSSVLCPLSKWYSQYLSGFFQSGIFILFVWTNPGSPLFSWRILEIGTFKGVNTVESLSSLLWAPPCESLLSGFQP